jgi:hypothetical protein
MTLPINGQIDLEAIWFEVYEVPISFIPAKFPDAYTSVFPDQPAFFRILAGVKGGVVGFSDCYGAEDAFVTVTASDEGQYIGYDDSVNWGSIDRPWVLKGVTIESFFYDTVNNVMAMVINQVLPKEFITGIAWNGDTGRGGLHVEDSTRSVVFGATWWTWPIPNSGFVDNAELVCHVMGKV